MKASQLPLFTQKEIPADAVIISHQLLLRAGYIMKQFSGLYSYLPLGYMVHRKIEDIIRHNMHLYGAIEVHLPSLTSASLWKESNRWDSMGDEMFQLNDRHGVDFCLAPTHEEAVTVLVKQHLNSYKQLPINIYQMTNKYRDEIRPRYGLIRSREFMMKDAYSFHENDQCLSHTYTRMRECYHKIFQDCSLDVVVVEADSGSMGGSNSEEFMLLASVGESTLLFAKNANEYLYKANQETVECIPYQNYPNQEIKDLELKDTPQVSTISDVSYFLDIESSYFIKILVYENEQACILALIPGDRNVNLHKLEKISGQILLTPASSETLSKYLSLIPGFIGPVNLPLKHGQQIATDNGQVKMVHIYYDRNLKNRQGLVTGGNEINQHYINVQENRDFHIPDYSIDLDLIFAEEGDRCPTHLEHCLTSSKGLELGHIFKLGTRYCTSLGLSVLNHHGKKIHPTMGCYGIGVSRVLQAIVEQHHDSKGILWPKNISPFVVYMVGIFKSEIDLKAITEVYDCLVALGISIYFDDRKERPGVKFVDSELLGLPFRIVLGSKYLEKGDIEWTDRATGQKEVFNLEELCNKLLNNLD